MMGVEFKQTHSNEVVILRFQSSMEGLNILVNDSY